MSLLKGISQVEKGANTNRHKICVGPIVPTVSNKQDRRPSTLYHVGPNPPKGFARDLLCNCAYWSGIKGCYRPYEC